MRWARWGLLVVATASVLAASATWSVPAQDRPKGPGRANKEAAPAAPRGASVSVQDALLRPFDLPFAEETTLEAVRLHLTRVLGAPVVLDRSALDRLELTPQDTVQLELKGVRLKVGLKLLLDQVGLSYRVEAEDNLLILTDPESGDEPARRIAAELKSLHRDLHDLQDAVDDLRDLVEEEIGVEPEVARQHSTLVGREKAGRSAEGRGSRSPRSPDRRVVPSGRHRGVGG